MNPQQPIFKEIAGEITQTTMGKETDSQSMREGKNTPPKHITVNEIPTTIPRWNDRTLRNLTMVEEDTKLCVNRGKNQSTGQKICEAEENHLAA